MKFYVRRIFRILPAYFTYLAAVAAISVSGAIPINQSEWLSCLLFFRNYLPDSLGQWYLGHFWSLSVEEHFYLLWPPFLRQLGEAKKAAVFIPLLAMGIAAWRSVDFHHHFAPWVWGRVSFFSRTDIRADGLLWGCFGAVGFGIASFRENLRRLAGWLFWLTTCGIAIVIKLQPPMSESILAIGFSIWIVSTVSRPNSAVSRLLEISAVRLLGRMSYSLYLWQQLFLPDYKRGVLGWVQEFPWNIIFLIASAYLSYRLIETPMVNVGRRLVARHGRGRELAGNRGLQGHARQHSE